MPDQIPHATPVEKRRNRDGVSKNTLFISLALMAIVAFVAGTRSDQIMAVVAPVFGVKTSADSLDTTVLQETYRDLASHFDGQLDKSALADGAARGMVAAAGDRYTVFMDAKEAEEFDKELSGEISGVGCEIGRRSDQPTVLRVLTDSPAAKAGIQVGDVFVAVNDESVVGKDAGTVAEKVRGDEGTSVKLKMRRGTQLLDFTITRAQVSDPSVRWTTNDGIGRVTISRFDTDTGDLVRRAATEFKSANVKGVIVDLRDNGGGYLDAARDVAGVWLNDQVVVTEKTNGKVTDTVKTGSSAILGDTKTIVLVNGDSASASEIVAGALQEYGKATLVGKKTFGKGTVQEVLRLDGGRILKVTVARWYTPKGKNITKEGITPDKTVELTADDTNNGRDPQLTEAVSLLQ